MEIEPVDEEEIKFVNKLGRIVHRRLLKHIRIKINDTTKHNHPTLIFVCEILNRFAAIISFLVKLGQVR